jgi:hypothetical protein
MAPKAAAPKTATARTAGLLRKGKTSTAAR